MIGFTSNMLGVDIWTLLWKDGIKFSTFECLYYFCFSKCIHLTANYSLFDDYRIVMINYFHFKNLSRFFVHCLSSSAVVCGVIVSLVGVQ